MRRAVSEADKGQRREDILAAAKRVFARNGFHQTAMADIAKEAALSYGSVYWYFDSKEALYQALTEREEAALWEHVGAALEGVDNDDPEATLMGAVRATFEFFAADPAAVRLLSLERFTDDIEGLIVDAQRRGAVIDAPARIVAFSVASLVGAVADRLAHDDGADADATAEFLVTLLLNGLRPR
jgi:AcrR family transcriptional regulator